MKDTMHLTSSMDNSRGYHMKKIIIIVLFPIVVSLILFLISPIFVPKWTSGDENHVTQIVRGYYAEKKNSLDVLFMGNSDMYRGVIPIELYEQYGIASYSYTSPGQRAWTSYYVLSDALRSQHPDVIVFNVDGLQFTNHSTSGCYRKSFDNMQLSLTKIKALMDPTYEFTLADKLSFIFPVFRFHSRISEITKEDFKNAYGYKPYAEKGYDMIVRVRGYKYGSKYMDDKGEKYEIPETSIKYLNMIKEKCKKENITLILTEIPSADSWSLAQSKAFQKYAKDNNLTFLDFNLILDELNFDWSNDTCDRGDHLNIYGAKKATKYMGEYLKANYKLPDRRKDSKYKTWNKQVKEYYKDVEKALNEV